MDTFHLTEKESTMAKRSHYPPEFRRKIIDLAHAGRGVSELAREFQVARQSIVNWVKQDDRDSGRRTDGLTSAEQAEMTKLRRRVRELETERDILKKAAADSTDQRNTPIIFDGGAANGSVRPAGFVVAGKGGTRISSSE